jgi:hypothetical protein
LLDLDVAALRMDDDDGVEKIDQMLLAELSKLREDDVRRFGAVEIQDHEFGHVRSPCSECVMRVPGPALPTFWAAPGLCGTTRV